MLDIADAAGHGLHAVLRRAAGLLSFGAGPHYCLDANLARMTVEETVRGVLALGPLEPAVDPWTVEWRQVLGRAPATLPVHVA